MNHPNAVRRLRASGIAYGVLAILVLGSPASPAITPEPAQTVAPDSLTDAEFWKFFTSHSEADGYFLSENFVSNEVSFQEVIPTLQESLTSGGVYLGVGPEQNFTYIANLKPRMAVIFDIRRQNAMQHLMYKAIFELSPTRAEFVARLFSRPSVAAQPEGIAVKALFDSALAAPSSDSAYRANLQTIIERLTVKHGFTLSPDDIATIEHVYKVFFSAGPDVNYGYRMGSGSFIRTTYPTFATLQSATNADSVEMAFLANNENYQAIRSLQLRNLIVPVVGDFGGPSAIRAVGSWLAQRQMIVTAFYVSNVEQYLFRDRGASDRFYANVSALPLDQTSSFIRSVPGMGTPMSFISGSGTSIGPGMTVTIVRDSMGYRLTRTIRDSAGVPVVVDSSSRVPGRDSTTRDTSVRRDTSLAVIGQVLTMRRDSIARANAWQLPAAPLYSVVRGGLLASGLAPMQKTLERFFAGQLTSYDVIVNMTKVSGWR